MSVESEIIRVQYAGNGTTTNFSFPYAFLDATDLDVYLVDSSGVGTFQTFVSQYDVIGAYDPLTLDYTDFSAGASVNFVTAPSGAYTVVILRNNPTNQDTSLSGSSAYVGSVLEYALDKLAMMVQFLTERSSRSIRLADYDPVTTFDMTLPHDELQASSLISINAAGTGLESTLISGLLAQAQSGTVTPLPASKAVVSDSAGALDVSATTSTELGYVSGVTSAIQTQLNGKQATLTLPLSIANGGSGAATKAAAFDALQPMTTSGDIIYGGASGTGTRLAKGSDGQVLTLASGVPSWAAASGSVAIAALLNSRVTGSAPTTLGQYRSYLRTGGTVTLTETNGAPTAAPSSADGIALYADGSGATGSTSNHPIAYDIFIGANKKWTLRAFATSSRAGIIDISPGYGGVNGATGIAAQYGYHTGYNPTTGIFKIWALAEANSDGHFVGKTDAYGAATTGFFDLYVSDI